MNNEWGICSCHGTKNIIVNKRHNLCAAGNRKRLDDQAVRGGGKAKEQKTWKPKARKATGEGVFFLAIAQVRNHRCFVCDQPLRPITFSSMAHVLSKKQYPKMRLLDRNIQLLCPPMSENKCHHRWDFEPRSELRKEPEWNKMFELEEQLKEEYKQL